MAEAAMWGGGDDGYYTVTDNEYAREDSAAGGEAYVQTSSPGVTGGIARGHVWARKATGVEAEPRAVWLIVVGSIGALFLLGKAFKTARA